MRATAALVLLALFAGCRDAAPAAPRTFTDDLGRTVGVPARPGRVVPLAPSLTELVVAAGGLSRLAAVTPYETVPASVRGLPTVATYPLDREALVALGADLVVGTDQVNDPADGDATGRLGVPAVYFRFGTLADVPRVLRRVGALLRTERAAAAAADTFAAQLARATVPPPRRPPATLVLIGTDVLYAFGGASYVHEMVRRAGGASVTRGFAGEGVTLAPEWVVARAPERIVVLGGPERSATGGATGAAAGSRAALLAAQPAWAAVPAVRTGHVCSVDADLLSRPGPRLPAGVAALRACLAAP